MCYNLLDSDGEQCCCEAGQTVSVRRQLASVPTDIGDSSLLGSALEFLSPERGRSGQRSSFRLNTHTITVAFLYRCFFTCLCTRGIYLFVKKTHRKGTFQYEAKRAGAQASLGPFVCVCACVCVFLQNMLVNDMSFSRLYLHLFGIEVM